MNKNNMTNSTTNSNTNSNPPRHRRRRRRSRGNNGSHSSGRGNNSNNKMLASLVAVISEALNTRQNAKIELLPDMPTTIAVRTGTSPAALFMLPWLSLAQACKLLDQPMPRSRDRAAEVLFEEERVHAALLPDVALDQLRGEYDAC